jgi:arginase
VNGRLVRVPAAWGVGGEAMNDAARMDIGLDGHAVIAEMTLDAQTAAIRAALPERPVLLGGCCCTHLGGVAGLAGRGLRPAVVWVDAHGDLNTPETSPSGNAWGMPFRIVLDDGHARVEDSVLIGARSLDPGETEFIAASGLADSADGLPRVLDGTDGAYIAFDCDVLDPAEIDCFMPEPNGMAFAGAVALVERIAASGPVLGMGLTGLVASDRNPALLRRLVSAAGLA